MLRLEKLSCGYGRIRAVTGLDLTVEKGTIVALVGANGAGKTSTIQCIAGHVSAQEGHVLLNGKDITGITPQQRVAAGIAIAPEGRKLFADLTVRENLVVGGFSRPKERTPGNMERVLALFPRLGERIASQAGSLSGGEQQMAAIGRALMAEPELLMIDEVSLGLMPKNVDICYQAIGELKRAGMTILLVEQNTTRALEVADHVFVLESGHLAWSGPAAEARSSSALIEAYMGTARAKH
jgi:branched-chain amino acid transport system ATP-binding protein